MTAPTGTDLRFEQDGAPYFHSAINDETCIAIEDAVAELPVGKAGVRIKSAPAQEMLATDGPVGSCHDDRPAGTAGPCRAVRQYAGYDLIAQLASGPHVEGIMDASAFATLW